MGRFEFYEIKRSLANVKLTRHGTYSELYYSADPTGWALVVPGEDAKSVVLEVKTDKPIGTEANAFVLETAIHLIRAGIWLKDDAWVPWFESIAREVKSQLAGILDCDFSVDRHWLRLSASPRDRFYLYPSSNHPNGDAIVKWIVRELTEKHTNKSQASAHEEMIRNMGDTRKVCVPESWSDGEIEQDANRDHPKKPWRLCHAGDTAIEVLGVVEREPCRECGDRVHVVLER